MSFVGKRLGKYKLVELIGQGGMAHVYKAFQPGVERVVAVKVMHEHLCEDQSFVRRFQREAKAISRLKHPNIVGFIDFDHEQNQYYLVMSYITGGTLRDYLQKSGPLPPLQALQLILSIAKGLACAHQHGIIHRDIKPSNIMFLDQNHSHPVLTDFGLARLSDHKHTTITSSIAGTPSYMSPEALHNEKIDERSDIYSLGIVLYKMVVGSTPYTADTPYGIFLKRINEPLPTPRERNPSVPESVEKLILNALAQKPKDRYQSATHFCEAIEATIAQLMGQKAPAKSSYASFLSVLSQAPKSITLKSLKPTYSLKIHHFVKPRRTLSALLGISSGLCATAALTLMLLFGFNGKAPRLNKIVKINPSQPAISSPQAPENEEDAPIFIETTETGSEAKPYNEDDPWPNEQDGPNIENQEPQIEAQGLDIVPQEANIAPQAPESKAQQAESAADERNNTRDDSQQDNRDRRDEKRNRKEDRSSKERK